MTTKTCPLCGSQEFFMNTKYPAGGVLVGVFKTIACYSLVCLTCGSVDQVMAEVETRLEIKVPKPADRVGFRDGARG